MSEPPPTWLELRRLPDGRWCILEQPSGRLWTLDGLHAAEQLADWLEQRRKEQEARRREVQ
jgi:hypothetical protein